ncbi:MAG: DUF86 domain-containing protein [Nitrospirae bacterium]|nr:DUF86 domain-containing protein [Nitrospirota bacterium]
MSRHDDLVRFRHILDHAREAAALVRNKRRDDLDSDRVLSLALVRLLEIVGEAANRVSEDERARHADIAWAQIVSLRNRLVHGYDSVDMDILWRILHDDLPLLIAQVEKLLPREPER